MATLAPVSSSVPGVTLTDAAAAGGGDVIKWSDRSVLVVRNGDASATTVTVVTPGTKYGAAIPDVTYSVPAGGIAVIGPFNYQDFVDTATGNVSFTYSKVTSLTVSHLVV